MAQLVKDPVCGMDVDPDTSAARSEYEGTTYYFCAEGCKLAFDEDPPKYLQRRAAEAMPSSGTAPAAASAPAGAAEGKKRWWEFWK
jgi:Cu+-exporting ATPase